jgi:hypothetical protein
MREWEVRWSWHEYSLWPLNNISDSSARAIVPITRNVVTFAWVGNISLHLLLSWRLNWAWGVTLSMVISRGVVVAADQIHCVLLKMVSPKILVSMATHCAPPWALRIHLCLCTCGLFNDVLIRAGETYVESSGRISDGCGMQSLYGGEHKKFVLDAKTNGKCFTFNFKLSYNGFKILILIFINVRKHRIVTKFILIVTNTDPH